MKYFLNKTIGELNVLKVLNVLNVLNVLIMPKDPSLACWALFFNRSRTISLPLQNKRYIYPYIWSQRRYSPSSAWKRSVLWSWNTKETSELCHSNPRNNDILASTARTFRWEWVRVDGQTENGDERRRSSYTEPKIMPSHSIAMTRYALTWNHIRWPNMRWHDIPLH